MATTIQALSIRAITVILLCFWHLPSFGQSQALLNTNKKLVTRYFDEVINTQKLIRMGEFFSTDYYLHTMDGKDIRSSQDSTHIAMIRWLYKAIPDVHYTIDHILAERDMVAINTTATGTAKAELFGLPAGLQKVRFRQMFFYRLKNNQITEQWEVVDVDGLKAQLTKP
jgi:predicted ester cyclase